MDIIDIHTHVFPDKIAERAVRELSAQAGVAARSDGTLGGLGAQMERCGIAASALQMVATKPAQTPSINEYCLRVQSPRFFPFGALHPDLADPDPEIERLRAGGILGVKFHPDYQQFFVDEPRMLPLYRKLAQAGLIVLFHAGVDIGLPPPVHCTPERLARVLDAVPELTVIAAHLGGFQMWDEVERRLVGRKLLLDTAYTLPFMPREQWLRLVRGHGAGRVLFGSDSPWADPGEEIALLRASGLDESELAAILHDNAARLLGIG